MQLTYALNFLFITPPRHTPILKQSKTPDQATHTAYVTWGLVGVDHWTVRPLDP